MKTEFTPPENIKLWLGEKRTRLDRGDGILMWYRRDLDSVMITPRYGEERDVGCVFYRTKKENTDRWRGCLVYLGTKTKEKYLSKLSNYAFSLGGGYYMSWIDGRPLTYRLTDPNQPIWMLKGGRK